MLAHSMGNLALQIAVENWFLHGNGNAKLLDVAILAAGETELLLRAPATIDLTIGSDVELSVRPSDVVLLTA